MSIQDLFGKSVGIKGSSAESLESQARSVESEDFTTERLKEKQRFIPQVDFSNPANFARYGLAAKYYSDAFELIADTYPYDGSLAEKLEWENSASFVDLYVFENEYPRTNGYITLGLNYGSVSVSDNGYGDTGGTNEYISLKGTLQTASVGMAGKPLSETFDKANQYDPTKNRGNNLSIDGEDGITIEFWLNKSSSVAGESDKQVIFDVWNQVAFGSAGYGRFRLEIHPGTVGEQDKFYFEIASGSDGAGLGGPVAIGNNLPITSSNWNHFAVSFANTGSSIIARLYQNGNFVTSSVTGTAINEVTGNLVANVGALRTSVLGTDGELGWAKLSGSLDELRFWKTRRTAEQIGRNWFTQVGGGANTDEANITLGLYYKFNEGTTQTDADRTILDYSGRIANGFWTGYTAAARSTGSAMVLARAADREFLDPIIYDFHPDHVATKARLIASGTIHDDTNNAAIYNTIPAWILQEDQRKGRKVLENLIQTIGSYFDTLHLQIQALPNLRDRAYTTEEDQKPRPFAKNFLENAGFVAPDILQDAFALEAIANRNDTKEFEEKFFDVRNRIYENVYSNLVYINKMKGTQEAFRNLIRCFGVGDEVVRLSLYANNIDFELTDKFRQTIHRTNVVDFNDPDRFDSTVYQTSSTADERSFVNFNALGGYKGETYECDVVFPKKFDRSSPLYFVTNFTTASIFGCHEAFADQTNFNWEPPDTPNFQVQAIRTQLESNDVYFQLTGTDGWVLPKLTSSVFKDVYDNNRWVFAVTVKHPSVFGDSITGSANLDFEVEFSGYNYLLDVEQNSFKLTGTIPAASGTAFLSSRKRFFVGAHRTDFVGQTRELSDVKVSALRVWNAPLADEALVHHAKDPTNFGTLHPYRSTFLSASVSGSSDPGSLLIPEIGSLALHWTFDNVTGSGPSSDGLPTTSDATFVVQDISSGSSFLLNQFQSFNTIVNVKHPGKGAFFLPNSSDVVQREYLNAAKLQFPDTLTSDDLVKIISEYEEKIQTKDQRPIEFFYALEKSMSQVISDQAINYFGTIKDFNNLIGDPLERYQQEYRNLKKIRQFFFDKVENVPSFQKFVEYFKWIDDSISRMIYEILPASANFSPQIRTLVESHILERNKYWSKPPTLEFKGNTLVGNIDVAVVSSSKMQNPADNAEMTRGWNKQKIVSVENVKNSRADRVFSASVRNAHQPLGNYRKDYELVQLTGRTTNNKWLVERNAALTGAIFFIAEQAVNIDIADYELPNRTPNEYIFVNRFSAPGEPATMARGSLDLFAEEYSAYNSMNFRNSTVREALDEFWSIHTQQNLSSSVYTGQPNFHKINRNPLSLSSGILYNNYFYTSLIPQSDIQYAWTSASLNLTTAQPVGFTSDFTTPSGTTSRAPEEIVFITSSQLVSGSFQDFAGTTNFVVDTVFTESNLLSSSGNRYVNDALYSLTPQLEQHLLHLKRNGPYQGSNFRLSFKADHPVARSLRRNNIIGLINQPQDRVIIKNGTRRTIRGLRSDGFTNFDEAAVIYKYKPLINTFRVRGSKDPVVMRHTYANNITKFSNVELNNRLGLEDCEPQMYDRLRGLYIDPDLNEEENPITGFVRFSYTETVFPKEKNAGKRKVRIRTKYAENFETTGTSVYGTWVNVTSSVTNSPYPQDDTLSFRQLSSPSYGDNGVDRQPIERRSFWHSDFRVRNRIAPPTIVSSSRETWYISGTKATTIFNSQGFKDASATSIFPFGTELEYEAEIQPSTNLYANVKPIFLNVYERNQDFGELDANRHRPIQFAQKGVWASNLVYFLNNSENDYVVRDDGRRGGSPFSDNTNTGISNQSPSSPSDLFHHWLYPTASAFYVPSFLDFIIHYNTFGFEIGSEYPISNDAGPHRFRIPALTSGSKFPAYDTYEDFAADIRYAGKDYSTIPEFRISEHIPYYVDEQGGNFRARNDRFLEMIGGEITQSAEGETTSFTEEFFKTFAHSDELKYFETFVDDHGEDSEVSRITLTCNGIKKLLPYNGFYPANRTLQLAQLFSQSIAPNISGIDAGVGFPSSGVLATKALLQPFFAPGILYNTIKSGIAVDYPIITGSEAVSSSIGASSLAEWVSAPPNYRFPFEVLVDLKNGAGNGGVPIKTREDEDKTVNYVSVHNYRNNTVGRFPFFEWDGREESPKYLLAMQNFLGSTIDFFLVGRSLKTAYSSQQKEFKSFENGKAYFMDINLRRSENFAMYEDRWGLNNRFYHSASSASGPAVGADPVPEYAALTYTGKYFGEPFLFIKDITDLNNAWNGAGPFVSGADGNLTSQFTYDDAAFAPYLPSYYYGASKVRLKYVADGTEESVSNLINKIQSEATLEFFNDDLLQKIAFYNSGSSIIAQEQPSWVGKQNVTSSLNIFGIAIGKQASFDPKNIDQIAGRTEPISVEDSETNDFNRWVVYPKMEVPVLNFVNQPREYFSYRFVREGETFNQGTSPSLPSTQWITSSSQAPVVDPAPTKGARYEIPRGMWSGYGEIPQGSTGIFFNVEESFSDLTAEQRQTTGSLIDILGFDTTEKRIGELAESRTVYEAIVAIPFVDDPIKSIEGFAPTVNVAGRNFFSVGRANYNKQRNNVANGQPAVQRGGAFGDVEADETSISRMSQGMRKYVIPPEFNFELYEDIPPFVMYFLEFEHTFDRQDLADIWQNVLPEIGTKAEKDEVTFSHDMAPWEFFEGRKLPSRVRWLIFKVKQKAEWSYFAKTADTRDDSRFRFDFRTAQDVVPDYSYNYPYDYFSLVELAKIEATIDIEPKSQQQNERRTLTPRRETFQSVVEQASDIARQVFITNNIDNE